MFDRLYIENICIKKWDDGCRVFGNRIMGKSDVEIFLF